MLNRSVVVLKKKERRMRKRNTLENQPLPLETTLTDKSIPFLGGRPDRLDIISEDEILDLKITLNITKTVDEFLETI
jgi:hypothetical protein